MYQNQNQEGLSSLKWEGLEKLETSLLRLLDSVKLNKSLKIIEHRIQTSKLDIENQESMSQMFNSIQKQQI